MGGIVPITVTVFLHEPNAVIVTANNANFFIGRFYLDCKEFLSKYII